MRKDNNSVVLQFPNQIFLYRADSGDERNTVSDNEREKTKFYLTVTTLKECYVGTYLLLLFQIKLSYPPTYFFFLNGESEAKGCFYPWDPARQFFSWKGPAKEEEREGQEDEGPEAEISRGCHEKGHEKGKKR